MDTRSYGNQSKEVCKRSVLHVYTPKGVYIGGGGMTGCTASLTQTFLGTLESAPDGHSDSASSPIPPAPLTAGQSPPGSLPGAQDAAPPPSATPRGAMFPAPLP